VYKLILEVKEVKGDCAAGYKTGDRIVIEGGSIISRRSSNVCLYALGALLPYLTVAYRKTPKDDWINMVEELQCPDSVNTVVFKVVREKMRGRKG
jgi:uncharacterized repeat protein (TIGR04076 family)